MINKLKAAMADFLLQHPGRSVADLKVAIFGLTFKPDIDDLRESPALAIAAQLCRELKASPLLVEPNIKAIPAALSGCELLSIEQAIDKADICLILVAHKQFKGADFSTIPEQFVIDVVASGRS